MNHIGQRQDTADRMAQPSVTGSPQPRAGVWAARWWTSATVLRYWLRSRWVVAAFATLLAVAGLATVGDLLPGTRFAAFSGPGAPVPWWDYPLVAITAVLTGLIIASYIGAPIGAEATLCDTRWPFLGLAGTALATGPSSGDNLLTQLFAGTSPALLANVVQPVLGIAAAALLAWALATRLSREHIALALPTDETGATEPGACVTCRPLFTHRRPRRPTPRNSHTNGFPRTRNPE